jgi:aspartate aminotransferase
MAISEKMVHFSTSSSWIRKMFEKGASMKATYGADNVCDFSLGNPDVPPPPQFDEVMRELVNDTRPGVHGYMPNGGYPWVREAIAKRMSLEQQVTVDGGDMLMTCGAAGGLNITLKALLNPGEEVILLAPYFVDYRNYIDNHNGVSTIVATSDDFSLDLQAIEAAITPKTKAILINSPNNPSGQIYSADALWALGELLTLAGDRFDSTIYLIADEPYRKIVFDGHEVPSIFAAYRNSIVVSSYSKDLSLPGERIGYVAVHPEIEDKSALLNALTLANRILGYINAPALMQRAVAELQNATVDTAIYARRKELLCAILTEAGYSFTEPKGAFYIFPKSPIESDVDFVAHLLEEKILTVPGVGFGTPGYFRVAFCVPEEVIARSAEGFKRAIAKAKG